jgi:hypothetical protein
VQRAASRLLGLDRESTKEQCAFLECFLLHFRNLIEFLGVEEDRVQSTDLHVSNIWRHAGLPEPAQLPQIRENGDKLWATYERGGGRISRYLHHGTTHRRISKSWEVGAMIRALDPLLEELEKALGRGNSRSALPADLTGSNSSATDSPLLSD